MKTRNLSALFVMLLIASGLSGCKQVKRMFRNTTKEAQAFNNKLVAANKTINLAAQAFGRHLKPVLEGKKADSAALDKKFTEMKAAFDRVDQEMKGLKVPDLDGAKKLYDAHQKFLDGQREMINGTLKKILEVAKNDKLDVQAKRLQISKLLPEISKREGQDLKVLRTAQREFAGKNKLQLR
ncbi:MAG: hypothetical protein KC609_02695 [Myxococcales bacterium]|nr:hypothetical protein [Myxococcales bacterium]